MFASFSVYLTVFRSPCRLRQCIIIWLLLEIWSPSATTRKKCSIAGAVVDAGTHRTIQSKDARIGDILVQSPPVQHWRGRSRFCAHQRQALPRQQHTIILIIGSILTNNLIKHSSAEQSIVKRGRSSSSWWWCTGCKCKSPLCEYWQTQQSSYFCHISPSLIEMTNLLLSLSLFFSLALPCSSCRSSVS